MIIATENIILGDFTFKFEFGTISRHFYITPVYFKNKIINYKEIDTEFYDECEWFKKENYLKKDGELYKITDNLFYKVFDYKKIWLLFKDVYDNEYTSIINKESFVIFIKLLIYYYEYCKSER